MSERAAKFGLGRLRRKVCWVAGGLWPCMSELHWLRARQYVRTTSFNTPPYPVPFPLGLHALLLGSLDGACLQVELRSSFERRIA